MINDTISTFPFSFLLFLSFLPPDFGLQYYVSVCLRAHPCACDFITRFIISEWYPLTPSERIWDNCFSFVIFLQRCNCFPFFKKLWRNGRSECLPALGNHDFWWGCFTLLSSAILFQFFLPVILDGSPGCSFSSLPFGRVRSSSVRWRGLRDRRGRVAFRSHRQRFSRLVPQRRCILPLCPHRAPDISPAFSVFWTHAENRDRFTLQVKSFSFKNCLVAGLSWVVPSLRVPAALGLPAPPWIVRPVPAALGLPAPGCPPPRPSRPHSLTRVLQSCISFLFPFPWKFRSPIFLLHLAFLFVQEEKEKNSDLWGEVPTRSPVNASAEPSGHWVESEGGCGGDPGVQCAQLSGKHGDLMDHVEFCGPAGHPGGPVARWDLCTDLELRGKGEEREAKILVTSLQLLPFTESPLCAGDVHVPPPAALTGNQARGDVLLLAGAELLLDPGVSDIEVCKCACSFVMAPLPGSCVLPVWGLSLKTRLHVLPRFPLSQQERRISVSQLRTWA